MPGARDKSLGEIAFLHRFPGQDFHKEPKCRQKAYQRAALKVLQAWEDYGPTSGLPFTLAAQAVISAVAKAKDIIARQAHRVQGLPSPDTLFNV